MTARSKALGKKCLRLQLNDTLHLTIISNDLTLALLQVYVSCLRVLCKARGSVTWADTCATLSNAANSCGSYKGAHMKITDLLESAECTSNTATLGS